MPSTEPDLISIVVMKIILCIIIINTIFNLVDPEAKCETPIPINSQGKYGVEPPYTFPRISPTGLSLSTESLCLSHQRMIQDDIKKLGIGVMISRCLKIFNNRHHSFTKRSETTSAVIKCFIAQFNHYPPSYRTEVGAPFINNVE